MALPRPAGDPDRTHLSFARLDASASSIATSLSRTGWPGRGIADGRLHDAAATFEAAAALLRRFGPEVDLSRQRALDDIDATRTSVMRTLHVTSHAVSVALHAHGRDLYRASVVEGRRPHKSWLQSPYAIAPVDQWIARVSTAESLTADYLTAHAPGAAARAEPPGSDSARVARALAAWEIQSHRTLAARHTSVDHVMVARTQALATGMLPLLVDAARNSGLMPQGPTLQRLETTASRATSAWHELAGRWDDLAAPSDRHDPALVRTSAELHAALRELTHEAGAYAGTARSASHPHLGAALAALMDAAHHGPELVHVLAEQARRQDLLGRPAAVSRRAYDDIEAGIVTADPAGDVVWVSPVDIRDRRLVPLPPPVRECLQQATDSLGHTVTALASLSTLQLHATPAEERQPTAAPGTPQRERGCSPPFTPPAPATTGSTPVRR